MEYITMNYKEREQARIFSLVKEGVITQVEAAKRLRFTDRWVRKKMKRYDQFSDAGLVHKSRGKASTNRWDEKQEQLLIELLKGEWHGFGPTFAAEKFEQFYSIKVSREVVRQSMIRAHLWQPNKQRGKHRKRRERRPMLGMMVQLDGSPHDWFEGRAEACTLLVFIDDATSQILWLEFAKSESVKALMQATKNYVQKHGIPQSFYTDFGSVFHVNLNNAEGIKKTQWEQSCKELNIKVIHAHSPQAKGRVERCNQTMQDRLIKEMRLENISSIEAANKYLQTTDFIVKHNAKFSVQAVQNGNAHIDSQSYDLADVFSIKDTRILANDFTITFNNRIFQLHEQQRTFIRPKDNIIIKERLDGSIKLWVRKIDLNFTEIQFKPLKEIKEKIVPKYKQHKPNENSKRWASGFLPYNSESRVKPATPAVEAL